MRETCPAHALLALLMLTALPPAAHASARAEPTPMAPAAPSSAAPTSPTLLMPPSSRGQLLYENHCLGCHESNVHIRNRRAAASWHDVRARVAGWAAHLKLAWTQEEIDEVAGYLNAHFYHFAPP